MSVAEKFVEQLKADDVLGAISTIKAYLSECARGETEQVSIQVAESFKLKPLAEEKDEDDEDESEDESDEDDEKESDEDEEDSDEE